MLPSAVSFCYFRTCPIDGGTLGGGPVSRFLFDGLNAHSLRARAHLSVQVVIDEQQWEHMEVEIVKAQVAQSRGFQPSYLLQTNAMKNFAPPSCRSEGLLPPPLQHRQSTKSQQR